MSAKPGEPSAASAAWIGGGSYVLACVFWGMNIPLTATLFQTYDPYWLAFMRVSLAALLLAGVLVVTRGVAAWRSPIPIWRIVVMGVFASTFFAMYNIGLRHTNTITAAAIVAGSPVYGAVVSRIMIGARLEKGFWGAALLTLVGTLHQKGLAVSSMQWRLSRETEKKARQDATRQAVLALRGRADDAAMLMDLKFDHFRSVRLDGVEPMPMPRAAPMAMARSAEAAPPPVAVAEDIPVTATAQAEAVLSPR